MIKHTKLIITPLSISKFKISILVSSICFMISEPKTSVKYVSLGPIKFDENWFK